MPTLPDCTSYTMAVEFYRKPGTKIAEVAQEVQRLFDTEGGVEGVFSIMPGKRDGVFVVKIERWPEGDFDYAQSRNPADPCLSLIQQLQAELDEAHERQAVFKSFLIVEGPNFGDRVDGV